MKVLLCVPDLEKAGGIASYYQALKPHFSWDIEYFTRGARGDEPGGFRNVVRVVNDYARFAALLSRDDRISLVHINTSFGRGGVLRDAVFVVLAKLRKKKVLVFFRGWDDHFERTVDRLSARLVIGSFLSADRIVVLADRFGDKLRAWGFPREIVTESTVVDQRLIEAGAESPVSARSRSKVARFTILFLARLERRKGVYTAVDAFSALLGQYPELRLLIAGDGSERTRLARYVEDRRIKNVAFLGHVTGEAKVEAFRAADLYLFPSTHAEGMPNSVLEAMAFGLPVVARPVGGLSDFFVDGEMGRITEESGPDAFAQLVAQLIEDPDQRMRISRTNRRIAEERFAAPKVVFRIENIYREMLATGTPP